MENTIKWKDKWNRIEKKKYREITYSIKPLPHANTPDRRWATCLNRMRIVHSHLTHKHLMNKDFPPYCQDCLVPLTMKHILSECPSHIEARNLHLPPTEQTMKTMLEGANN